MVSGGQSDAASASTGTSFDYLVKTARRESAMNPEAKASTSSASGLFQFVEQTWLETVKLAGPSLGLKDMAARIVAGSDGRYRVPDPQAKAEILALRHDPEISAMMAGALTQRNATYLTERLGRAGISRSGSGAPTASGRKKSLALLELMAGR